MAIDPLPLKDRCCVVTGGGNGIGRTVALAFAEAGGLVACLDYDRAAAERTAGEIEAKGGKALGIGCDVSAEPEVKSAVERTVTALGPVRAMLHAAAPHDPNGTVLEMDPAEWNRVLSIQLTGAFLISRAVLPSMITAGGGSIILIASQLGRVGAARRPAYCAAKGALRQLAKAMAADHAAEGVRVNALSPGAVETARMPLRYGSMEAARERMGPKHLLNRLARPEEIAGAALFLAGDASSFITGTDLLVDGGYTAI